MERADRLQRIVKPISEVEAYFEVYRIATVLKNYIRVFTPHTPMRKLKPGMKAIKKKANNSALFPHTEDNLSRSLRRTKRLIKDIVDCNDFTLFVTLTFDRKKVADRYDPDLLKGLVAVWLKEIQKRIGKFDYLMVMEFHKDKAVHFHLLVNNYPSERLKDSGVKDDRGKKIYNLIDYPFGHTTASWIDNVAGAHRYITKYIQKDMPYFKGKRHFRTSHGLKRPEKFYNPDDTYGPLLTEPYRNEHGVTTFHVLGSPEPPVQNGDA